MLFIFCNVFIVLYYFVILICLFLFLYFFYVDIYCFLIVWLLRLWIDDLKNSGSKFNVWFFVCLVVWYFDNFIIGYLEIK